VPTRASGTSARGTARTPRTTLPTWTAGRRTTGTTRTARTSAKVSAGAAGLMLGRHRHVIINLRRGYNYPALLSIARFDNFAVFSALERSFKIVQAEIRFGPILAMTPGARFLQHRLDVLDVGKSRGFGCGRHFTQVQLFQIGLAIRQSGDGGDGEAGCEQATCFHHNEDYCCEYQLLMRNSKSSAGVIAWEITAHHLKRRLSQVLKTEFLLGGAPATAFRGETLCQLVA